MSHNGYCQHNHYCIYLNLWLNLNIVILAKELSENNTTITGIREDGDPEIEYGHIVYLDGEGFRLGRCLYDKYGIVTHEILERGLVDPNPDDEEV